MIAVSEAKKQILDHCTTYKPQVVPLLSANGFVLAAPVFSVIDSPPFHQSAMDGYAFSFKNWDKKSALIVIGEIQAGTFSNNSLGTNEAFQIFTGAPIPSDADAVVMQEKVIRNGNVIQIQDIAITGGANVRPKGSQTKKGEIALSLGDLVTPIGISFLAGLGINEVTVFSKPKVSIIVTGKELINKSESISEGKIYESNAIGLTAALQQINIEPTAIELVDDTLEEIKNAITTHLNADILILTGGVSVGDYDLVPAALEKCGVEKIFHKVKQKPGKPLYFGKVNQTLIFALPGNPAAALTCFYEYVLLAIDHFTYKKHFKKMQLPLANDFYKKAGLTHFLKGKTSENAVSILENQESYKLNSFATANCLITLDENSEYFKKGDLVTCSMIL